MFCRARRAVIDSALDRSRQCGAAAHDDDSAMTTACHHGFRGFTPDLLWSLSASLQAGDALIGAPQPHARGPNQGRSGWASHTQRQLSHRKQNLSPKSEAATGAASSHWWHFGRRCHEHPG